MKSSLELPKLVGPPHRFKTTYVQVERNKCNNEVRSELEDFLPVHLPRIFEELKPKTILIQSENIHLLHYWNKVL